MRALLSETPGGPETLLLRELPDPTPGPGELLVLYSDGVIESPSANGDDFGTAGILRSLPASICARTVASAIASAATRHAVGRAQYDDLTVMVISA